MTDAIAVAKDEVQHVISDLEAIRKRLVGVTERLPAGPAENDPEMGSEGAEESTELRTVIECVLHDALRPLIEDLRAVAGPELE